MKIQDILNPTDEQIESNVWIGMTSSGLASRVSRAPMIPSYFWSENVPLPLSGGAT